MKVGIVTPHLPNRSKFIKQRNKLMSLQTRKADIDIIIADPYTGKMDLNERYYSGFDYAFKAGAKIVLCIEDDDWYRNDYIEIMLKEWLRAGCPDLVGIENTIYYHIGYNAYKLIEHPGRASMFCTAVTKEIMKQDIFDGNAFLDIRVWKSNLSKRLFIPKTPIAMGIKHNDGVTGGSAHKSVLGYEYKDFSKKYLREITNDQFYETYSC